MDQPPGLDRYLPALLGIALVFALAIALAFDLDELSRIAWMARAPHVDHVVEGPAIYSGTLVGPADRRTPDGREAAAFWAWVEDTDSDSNSQTMCGVNARTELGLETADGLLPIPWLDAKDDVSLSSDDSTRNLSFARAIDAGAFDRQKIDGFPDLLASCAGDSRAAYVQAIPTGQRAEVLACAKDGQLGICPGEVEGVLAVPSIKAHMRHRAEAALAPLRVVEIIGVCLLLLIGSVVAQRRLKAFELLRPEHRR